MFVVKLPQNKPHLKQTIRRIGFSELKSWKSWHAYGEIIKNTDFFLNRKAVAIKFNLINKKGNIFF